MPNLVLTRVTASVSELKRNPMGTVAQGEGAPVAILNRNEPAFYCVPARAYESLIDQLEDAELARLAAERSESRGETVKATITDSGIVFDGANE